MAARRDRGGVHDVIVVGAGFAGLSAARRLVEAGLKVCVLEARDRVGGRVESRTLSDGHAIDLGGQWIGPTQTELRALADELGAETFRQFDEGRKIMSICGAASTYHGTIPSLPVWSLLDLQQAMSKLDRLARTVDLDAVHAPGRASGRAPGRASGGRASGRAGGRAAAWDAMTVETWKRRNVFTKQARAALDFAIRSIFAAEASELSFLHFLFYLRSGGGLMSLASVEGGAQQERFHGGVQPLAEKLARASGAELILGAPVRAVRQDADGCTVISDAGEFRAAHVVVAVPPVLAGRMHYDPALPARRDALTQRMPMGSVIKCVAAYREPFWRRAGYSGELLSDGDDIQLAFDDSSEDGSQAALVGFILGNAAKGWTARSPAARRRAVLSTFARYFGDDALDPLDFAEKDWPADEWSRGCYAAFMTPGTMTSVGDALREPCGRIHWAGTECATVWNGYIEGAIRSGYRAAEEVRDILDRLSN